MKNCCQIKPLEKNIARRNREGVKDGGYYDKPIGINTATTYRLVCQGAQESEGNGTKTKSRM